MVSAFCHEQLDEQPSPTSNNLTVRSAGSRRLALLNPYVASYALRLRQIALLVIGFGFLG